MMIKMACGDQSASELFSSLNGSSRRSAPATSCSTTGWYSIPHHCGQPHLFGKRGLRPRSAYSRKSCWSVNWFIHGRVAAAVQTGQGTRKRISTAEVQRLGAWVPWSATGARAGRCSAWFGWRCHLLAGYETFRVGMRMLSHCSKSFFRD
jgi:hypothetical protein